MSLPLAGNLLATSNIQGEFGGYTPTSLTEYYAGGVYVPTGAIGFPLGVSTPIPASGMIAISNFYGAQAGTYSVVGKWAGNNVNVTSNVTSSDTLRFVVTSVSNQEYLFYTIETP